jgi:hypothetical protein
LAKLKSGFEKRRKKRRNTKRGKRKERNLATFADHHCIEVYNPIESETTQKIQVDLKRKLEAKSMIIK